MSDRIVEQAVNSGMVAHDKIHEECNKEIKQLRARVEELEKEKHPEISVTAGSGGIALYVNGERRPITPHALDGLDHRITSKMIDAAVAIVEIALSGCGMSAKSHGWAALNKLNIYRCEGCGGSCWSKEEHQSPCPTCHGHGWTIGDQK